MATQAIEQILFPDLPQDDITTLATAHTLTSTGVDNGFEIPFNNLKQILIYNGTTSEANVTLKAQTPETADIKRYLDTVTDDFRLVIGVGKIGCVKPNYLLATELDTIIIEADQKVTVIPFAEWSIDI